MCGINGIYSEVWSDLKNRINKMNEVLKHRGPDENGIFITSNFCMGMQRLSIIDLVTGSQPIYNKDKSKVIIFNGEIYNYKELREELVNQGVNFMTNGDTEVILALFEKYGPDSFSRLIGMFAFAIYDIYENKLTISRDRSGEKPLYYYFKNGDFVFSSELKGILTNTEVERKINKKALNSFFQLTYIPSPYSILNGIFKLEPGSFLTFSNKSIIIKSYLNKNFSSNKLKTKKEAKIKLTVKLEEAVKKAMISDVPIGVFLSGGIDSSIIAYLASKNSNLPINTFTFGIKNTEFDETKNAESMSKLIKSNHKTFYFTEKEIVSSINYILNNLDEPFGDYSIVPTYLVSKKASQYVKTVLTGDGGDELFAGYEKYQINNYCNIYSKLPYLLKKLLNIYWRKLDPRTSLYRKIGKVIKYSSLKPKERILQSMVLGFEEKDLKGFFKPKYFLSDPLDFIKLQIDKNLETMDLIKSNLVADQKFVLEGDMLAKVDRASMLCSLETRIPFLNPEIINFANEIPTKYKIDIFSKKKILKQTFKSFLSKQVYYGKKKGFSIPISHYISKENHEIFANLLDFNFIEKQGIFEFQKVINLFKDHFDRKLDNGHKLWCYIVFQKWYLNYINV